MVTCPTCGMIAVETDDNKTHCLECGTVDETIGNSIIMYINGIATILHYQIINMCVSNEKLSSHTVNTLRKAISLLRDTITQLSIQIDKHATSTEP